MVQFISHDGSLRQHLASRQRKAEKTNRTNFARGPGSVVPFPGPQFRWRTEAITRELKAIVNWKICQSRVPQLRFKAGSPGTPDIAVI